MAIPAMGPDSAWEMRHYSIVENAHVPRDQAYVIHWPCAETILVPPGDGEPTRRERERLIRDYLPPAHRATLAEAISASDFADLPVWERRQFLATVDNRPVVPLPCNCRGEMAVGHQPVPCIFMHHVPISKPSSHWDYWCGQCQGCGTIYWHRGPEQGESPCKAATDILVDFSAASCPTIPQ